MNKKFSLILIVIFGILLISAIVYYVLYYSKSQSENLPLDESLTNNIEKTDEEKQDTTKTNDNFEKVSIVTSDKKSDVPLGQIDIERMAKSFSERFGSFSNQSNYSNITDLKMFMSKKMQIWADAYMAKNQKSNVADQVYYGLTSKALSAETKKFDDEKGEATVVVETRRREAMGTSNNSSKLYNQSITLTFVKENQIWKVDTAIWADK